MYEIAEGYNKRTGRDNFTNKTAAGIPRIATVRPSTTGAGLEPLRAADIRPALQGADAPAPAAAAPAPGSTGGASLVEQAQAGATYRKRPLDARLVAALQYAAETSGLKVKVTSGGQDESGPHRTGSHRHDLGLAGDFDLYDDKGIVSRNDPRRVKFLEEVAAAGAGGIGVGYMKDEGALKIHAGITGPKGPHGIGQGLGQYYRQYGSKEENAAIAKGNRRFVEDPTLLERRAAAAKHMDEEHKQQDAKNTIRLSVRHQPGFAKVTHEHTADSFSVTKDKAPPERAEVNTPSGI